ncbi:MAG: sulfite exporter TauE/SafE family protein [Phycisphaerae bacterium]|nr:sulfite exporter TauE/SafE family protein [Phycisphaerae bacterium]
MELTLATIITIMVLAFACEYMDSTLGMGYGTTLTPVFMLMGFQVSEIVPAILVSELCTGLLAGICHHAEGNVNFRPNNRDALRIHHLFSHPVQYFQGMRKSFPMHLKIALLFGACSAVGAVAAVYVAVNIPKFWLKMYIGVLVLSMGILILIFFNRSLKFSFAKVTGMGLLASFNKGISGGGYGPVVTAGQVLSGVEGKSAVGITSLAESITCFVGVVMYLLIGKEISWRLAPWIIAGAIASVPLSAKSVKFISERKLKLAIAIVTILLGCFTIYKTLK